MKIEVFYSKSIADPYFKPINELEYEKILDWDNLEDVLSVTKACENVFELLNIGNPTQEFRSMCVGDVVIFDSEQAFYCDSVGWRDVTKQMIPAGDSIAFREEK